MLRRAMMPSFSGRNGIRPHHYSIITQNITWIFIAVKISSLTSDIKSFIATLSKKWVLFWYSICTEYWDGLGYYLWDIIPSPNLRGKREREAGGSVWDLVQFLEDCLNPCKHEQPLIFPPPS
jgi:hypothetical protein